MLELRPSSAELETEYEKPADAVVIEQLKEDSSLLCLALLYRVPLFLLLPEDRF